MNLTDWPAHTVVRNVINMVVNCSCCFLCQPVIMYVVNKVGLDIYGQKIDNHDANGELVECPVCKKSVAASRFAPHLEKCLGIGRTGRSKRCLSQLLQKDFDDILWP